jgi:parvin
MDDPKLKALIGVLIDWINDELAEHRIIVQNLDEDMYDGQVLQKLLGKIFHGAIKLACKLLLLHYFFTEKLTGQKLDVPEVTQSEENQKQKLRVVLGYANRVSLFPDLLHILVPYFNLMFS